MTTLHATNIFNVRASMNAWLVTALAAVTLPSWLPSYSVALIAPESEIPTPSFSVNHIDVGAFDRYQGRGAQQGMAMLDVSCWVSRSEISWQAQLNTMQAMVHQVVLGQANGGVVIYDYTDPANPVATPYRAVLSNIQAVSTSPDPNPDVERVRILIDYRWTLKAS